MKNIAKFLTERKYIGFELDDNYPFSSTAEFLWFSTEGNVYGFMSEDDIEQWRGDYDGADEWVNAVLALKPGEINAEDGNNHYIRIKK